MRYAEALVLIGVGVMILAVPQACRADAAPASPAVTGQTFQEKGRQLRSDIDSAYRQLRAARALSSSISVGNDASAIVLRYVPVGSSFDDAVAILRAAGCSVRASKDRHLLATLVLGGVFDTKHTFAIDLTPQSPTNNPAVAAVSATIVLTYVPNGDRR